MQQHGTKYFARRHAPTQGELRGLEKWDLCFVIYKFSKITVCPGYKFDIFALFDFYLARQNILISEFLCE